MVVAEVCSSMKYPKRCQYKHAKQKKYHVRNWAEYNEGLRRRGDLTDTQQDGCARDARYVLRRVTLQPAQGGQRFAPGRATTPAHHRKRLARQA